MKLSLNWLADFADLAGISPKEIAARLTMSTCEVEGIKPFNHHLSQIKAVQIRQIGQHPDADKLVVCEVFDGQSHLPVVCGAANFKIGDILPFANIGVTLPNGLTIQKGLIRGVESQGMLCSEEELNIGTDTTGIMHLPESTLPGTPLAKIFLNVSPDYVIEIDNKSITHRPDLWGHLGIARELAAIFDRPLKWDRTAYQTCYDQIPREISDPLEVINQARPFCPRYTGLVVDRIQVAPSPYWMQVRLKACDIRAISNIVDMTNYVMLILGQPMHAFDRTKIEGNKIQVRLAQPDELFTSLDGQERKLQPSHLLITDAARPIALAGVIGGSDSEIDPQTKTIVLESANFEPATIRRAANHFDLRTDAAIRFEKSQDPENTDTAIFLSVSLLSQICPGIVIKSQLLDPDYHRTAPITIAVPAGFIDKRLGTNLGDEKAMAILLRLYFSVIPTENGFQVTVPSFRATKDISLPEDLVEEVGRIYGFDNIAPEAPIVPCTPPRRNEFRLFEWEIRRLFSVAFGFTEVYNYSFVGEALVQKVGLDPASHLLLKNPLASDQDRLRVSLIPGLLDFCQKNARFFEAFKIYEIGRTYHKPADLLQSPALATEKQMLVALIYDNQGDGIDSFYQIRERATNLFKALGMDAHDFMPVKNNSWAHPMRSIEIISMKHTLGLIAEVKREVLSRFDIPGRVTLIELDLSWLFALRKEAFQYSPISKFPSVLFEFTVLTDKLTPVAEIEKTVRKLGNPLIKDLEFLTTYEGKPIPEDKKSVSYQIEFQSAERTLLPDEIKNMQDQVVAILKENGFPLRM